MWGMHLRNVNPTEVFAYIYIMLYWLLFKLLALLFLLRPGEAGNTLCNVSESRYKDRQPRETQRICLNEGKPCTILPTEEKVNKG